MTAGPTTQDVKVILNPWDDKFTFAFDERELSDATLKKFLAMRGPVPTVSLSKYRLMRVRSVGDQTELAVAFKTAVKGHLDLFEGKRRIAEVGDAARDGIYKLHVQIIDADQNKVMSDDTVDARVVDGLAKAIVTVKTVSPSANLLIAAKLIPTEDAASSQFVQQVEPEIESIVTKGPISSAPDWHSLD